MASFNFSSTAAVASSGAFSFGELSSSSASSFLFAHSVPAVGTSGPAIPGASSSSSLIGSSASSSSFIATGGALFNAPAASVTNAEMGGSSHPSFTAGDSSTPQMSLRRASGPITGLDIWSTRPDFMGSRRRDPEVGFGVKSVQESALSFQERESLLSGSSSTAPSASAPPTSFGQASTSATAPGFATFTSASSSSGFGHFNLNRADGSGSGAFSANAASTASTFASKVSAGGSATSAFGISGGSVFETAGVQPSATPASSGFAILPTSSAGAGLTSGSTSAAGGSLSTTPNLGLFGSVSIGQSSSAFATGSSSAAAPVGFRFSSTTPTTSGLDQFSIPDAQIASTDRKLSQPEASTQTKSVLFSLTTSAESSGSFSLGLSSASTLFPGFIKSAAGAAPASLSQEPSTSASVSGIIKSSPALPLSVGQEPNTSSIGTASGAASVFSLPAATAASSSPFLLSSGTSQDNAKPADALIKTENRPSTSTSTGLTPLALGFASTVPSMSSSTKPALTSFSLSAPSSGAATGGQPKPTQVGSIGGVSSAPRAVESALRGQNISASHASGTLAAPSSISLPSDIRNLNLEDVMNKWSEDIDELSSHFVASASMVSKWDRNIAMNEKAISDLWRETQSCSVAHSELMANLDTILGQQRDLHQILDTLEREMDDLDRKTGDGGASGGSGATADSERESMYALASEVMGELDAMSLAIRDLIIELNKNGAQNGATDALSQVVAVLNAHLDSLQYLDESTISLQKRLADVSRACDAVTRDPRANQRRSTNAFH